MQVYVTLPETTQHSGGGGGVLSFSFLVYILEYRPLFTLVGFTRVLLNLKIRSKT